MPLYAYKAVASDGRSAQGQIDAHNVVDLEMRLQRMGLDLIRGKAVENRYSLKSQRISRREIIHFCFLLEQLTRAGVSILDSLSDLRDSLSERRSREIVAALVESIEGGKTLSQALAEQGKVFNTVFISLIQSGEKAGRLPDVLQSLTESLKWEDELVAQTKKLTLYPAFVGSIVLAATIFLMIHLVPQLKQFISGMGQTLPLTTRILFSVSDFFMAYGYLMLALPIVIIFACKIILRESPRARLRFDALKLTLPLIGETLRKIILARFANTFALLYASGIPILESIHTTQEIVGNALVKDKLEQVERLINEGQSVSSAFQSGGFFPPLLIRMLRIGESTGALDRALMNIAYFYHRDVKESIGKAQQLIEPTLTVALGLLLGWIMLSIMGPIYDIIGSIKA